MKIKLWGVRGSIPSPEIPKVRENSIRELFKSFFEAGFSCEAELEKFLLDQPRHKLGGFGGNTPCVQVHHEGVALVIDCGSGLRNYGYDVVRNMKNKSALETHILMTHFHWDHLMGLPFFVPLFIPQNNIHIFSPDPMLEQVIKTLFRKPYFPVSFEQLPSIIHFHVIEPRVASKIQGFEVTPYMLDHPDPCWGYKITRDGQSYAHCVDTEAKRTTQEELGADLPLYQNIDLMVFDAQYSLLEQHEKVNWGHASATFGIDIALREKIKKVAFMHHDPVSSDEKIEGAEAEAKRYYQNELRRIQQADPNYRGFPWEFAYEGKEYDLAPRKL